MDRKRYLEGLAFGASAFVLWGLLPLYWKMVSAISPFQIFAQRVVWSFLFVCLLLAARKNWAEFADILKDRREWLRIAGPALLIAMNWCTYIWAVNNGYVIEASLGYYINPLILTFLGWVFFKERLNPLQKVSIAFAAAGVGIKTVLYGRFPLVAIVLAVSFALYGLLKKKSRLNSVSGLGFETLVIGIPSLLYLVFHEARGSGITGNLPWTFWLLIALSGAITAVPLIFYAEGTKRLPLTIIGFLQYLSPTIQLFLGIFVFREHFDSASLLAFSPIWAGVVLFTYSQYAMLRGGEYGPGHAAAADESLPRCDVK
jgi:chloramphenicol-sensitive protein RarD